MRSARSKSPASAYSSSGCSQSFFDQIGTSYAPIVATSYCPAPVAMSWVTLSRSSFSGRIVKLTSIPVSLVKLSFVSFSMSTICGLPTMRTLSDFSVPPAPPPPPPPPPAPAQPASARAATVGSASAIENLRSGRVRTMCLRGRRSALDGWEGVEHLRACSYEHRGAHLHSLNSGCEESRASSHPLRWRSDEHGG